VNNNVIRRIGNFVHEEGDKTVKRTIILFNLLILFLLSACSGYARGPKLLKVMTHDSFSVSEDIIAHFEQQTGIHVQFIEAGDTGTVLNKAILSKNVPLADVLYGVDNTFISRAIEEGIFEPYYSHYLDDIPDQFKLQQEDMALPVDFGDVCPNFDVKYFEANNLTPPKDLEDLRDPRYKGLLVVENPATSSPGLAFLFSTISKYGDPGYLDYWQDLVDNDVKIVNDWETAYYSEFSRWGGTRPIVISYASSPSFEVLFSDDPSSAPPTEAITAEGCCFRQIEYVGILKGTKNRQFAEEFIDFMLSPPFQEDIPMQMFVFPVNENAKLEETFLKFLVIPENPTMLDPNRITESREHWISDWTEAILR
jgi:thiamine transport system substrate-binding protein